MCIVFTCGEHTFRKEVEGYNGLVCRCLNCGNYSASVIKSNPWFTFCFVPVLPLSIKGYEDVSCRICHFAQPLADRQDVQQLRGQSGQVPMQTPGDPNGWGGQSPPQAWNGQSPKPNEPMRYS